MFLFCARKFKHVVARPAPLRACPRSAGRARLRRALTASANAALEEKIRARRSLALPQNELKFQWRWTQPPRLLAPPSMPANPALTGPRGLPRFPPEKVR